MDQLILAFRKLKVTVPRFPRSPAVTIDHLPAEILAIIFEHLSNDDIFNLPHRICAKGLFNKEGQRRFSQHRTWIEPRSLQNLTHVSHHPIIREFVQELIFCLEMPCNIDLKGFLREHWQIIHSREDGVPGELTLGNFHTLAGIAEGSCQVCSGLPSLSDRWTDHKSTLEALQKLRYSGKDVKVLVEAFQRFKGFDVVSIDNYYRSAKERRNLGLRYFYVEERHNIGASRPTHLIPISSTVVPLLVDALSITSSKPSSFKVMGDANSWLYEDQRQSLSMDIDFLELTVPPSSISGAFSNMKNIELRGLSFYNTTKDEPDLRTARRKPLTSSDLAMNYIIGSAFRIEELTVRFNDELRFAGYTFGLPSIPVSKYLGWNRLLRLKKLDLAHFRVWPQYLVDFLKTPAKTLTHLTLEDILLNGSWESTFNELKGSFRLESLCLKSLHRLKSGPIAQPDFIVGECEPPYRNGGDEEALAWLCGRSETNPFRPPQPSS